MGYFMDARGQYHEGDAQPGDVVVPPQPAGHWRWDGSAWVADEAAAARALLQDTDAKMPRPMDEFLSVLQLEQPALYAALPQFDRLLHESRVAARAVLTNA